MNIVKTANNKIAVNVTVNEWIDIGIRSGWLKEAQSNILQRLLMMVKQMGGWEVAKKLLLTPDNQLPQNPPAQPGQVTATYKGVSNFLDRSRKYVLMSMLAAVCSVAIEQVQHNPMAFLQQAQQQSQHHETQDPHGKTEEHADGPHRENHEMTEIDQPTGWHQTNTTLNNPFTQQFQKYYRK